MWLLLCSVWVSLSLALNASPAQSAQAQTKLVAKSPGAGIPAETQHSGAESLEKTFGEQLSSGGIWLDGLNLSRSGTASQPLIAAGGNNISHVMWWDSFDGMRYARLTSTLSGTLSFSASNAIPVVSIFGDRQSFYDNRLGRQITQVRPPRDMRLLSDRLGNGHVIWENLNDQLLYSANSAGTAWTVPLMLEQYASAFDASTDISNTLHIAYVRLSSGTQPGVANPASQPGLYYRTRSGVGLSLPISVLPSNYLRAERADDLALSIAANARGSVIVTWFQPSQNQSFYVLTADAGKTWTPPLPISGSAAKPALASGVAVAPNGDFLLIYRDNNGKGCSFNQRRSTDGGKTWSAPQIILTDVSRCPQRWRFANAEDKLWMIGTLNQTVSPLASKGSANITANLLASWDGNTWSPAAEINLNTFDSGTNQSRQLSCFSIALAGNKLMGVGCDPHGDIWTSQVSVNLNNLIKAPALVWQRVAHLSNTNGPVGADVVMAQRSDGLISIWPQSEIPGAPPNEVYYARWSGTEWTQPSRILSDPHSRFEQLALAVSPDERLHLVWSNNRVFYSGSFERDAGVPEGWAKPVVIPSPVEGNRSPSLVADPRGNVVYVAYAVPFNEKRGIYLARSDDNGSTWQPPTLIFDAAAAQWESTDQPNIQLDAKTNTLHAVWLKSSLNASEVGQALYYAQSTDAGKTWSKAQALASGDIRQPQLAVAASGQVHVVWNHARGVYNTGVPYEANTVLSVDGGQHWSDASAIAGFGALSSKPSLAADGAGQLYLTGMSENTNGESSLIFAQWNGQGWQAADSLGLGQRAAERNQTSVALLPESGQLVTLMRTLILSDAGSSQFELLSTARQVTPVKLQPQATFTPLVATPEARLSPTPTDVPPQVIPSDIAKELQPQPTVSPVITQTAMIAIIVLGLLAIAFGFYRSRQR